MWDIAFGGGRITCIVLGVWGRPEGARDDGEAPFVPSSPHRTLAAPDANDGLRPCPADVSLFEAAVVFVVSPTTACKGLASRPPAVGVQRAVHEMPISVGQRPRETKHGKCDLARDPNPATCCQRRPVIQIPGRCSCCRSSFSRLNIALQALQCQGANRGSRSGLWPPGRSCHRSDGDRRAAAGSLGEGLVVCVHTTKMSGPPCDRALSASDVVALLGLSPVLEVLRVGSQLHPGFRSKEFSSTSSVLHKVLALWMHSRSRASREAIAGLVPER